MKSCRDIRREFIEFFEKRGHTFVPSGSLLPADDPTLLFANAGMNQFKDVFLGREQREYNRAANTQKCIRAGGKHNDLEDVGHDTCHHTFFEMLGNWSFGDYFKREAIGWAWELLTDLWGLPKERLYVTVFGGDESDGLAPDSEAERIWKETTDIDPSRVCRGGKKDNFWEMGETGPCGPCSEIHYDLTEDLSGAALVNADDPRVIEIWNLVFMEYNRSDGGRLSPLPARHVDTGMGLERIGMVLQNKRSDYATDLFLPIIEKIETLTDHRYGASSGLTDRFDVMGEDDIRDVAVRVIADHARALTFAIADGVIPSNEGRGYVLRRILRRAARYGRQYLKIDGAFLSGLVPTVVELMGGFFGELKDRRDYVVETIKIEEESFGRTLDKGIRTWWSFMNLAIQSDFMAEQGQKPEPDRLSIHGPGTILPFSNEDPHFQLASISPEDTIEIYKRLAGGRTTTIRKFALKDVSPQLIREFFRTPPRIDGEMAFKLYATYGFPIDLTQLMAREKGFDVDIDGYDARMARHREISGVPEAFKVPAITGLPPSDDSAKYSLDPIDATVLGWVVDKEFVSEGALNAGDEAAIVLDRTNFYPEQGGQVGDAGLLLTEEMRFAVRDTILAGQSILHLGVLETGTLRVARTVRVQVDRSRTDTMRNHTATHLLNWALRKVLGDHVNQGGSVVAPDRLRFDFTHNQPVAPEQLREVERWVNERVLSDEAVIAKTLPLNDARKIPGVRAVFGEKYPDPVRVLSIGCEDPLRDPDESTSVEFCGGTHLQRTSQVGLFKIISEESVAKGVRRITALTGREAVGYVQEIAGVVRELSAVLRVPANELAERLAGMQKEIKELRKRQGGESGEFRPEQTVETPHGNVLIGRSAAPDAEAMRNLCDRLRQSGAGAAMIGAAAEGKVLLTAMVSDELVGAGILKAGEWVKAIAPIVAGAGGGKPRLAQAGGKNPEKLSDALQAAATYVRDQIK